MLRVREFAAELGVDQESFERDAAVAREVYVVKDTELPGYPYHGHRD